MPGRRSGCGCDGYSDRIAVGPYPVLVAEETADGPAVHFKRNVAYREYLAVAAAYLKIGEVAPYIIENYFVALQVVETPGTP